MGSEVDIKVPDIGAAGHVEVIEIFVKPGDVIHIDSPLITLESDKASMEIPAPKAGTVARVAVKLGDKISQGDVILVLTEENAAILTEKPLAPLKAPEPIAIPTPPPAPAPLPQTTLPSSAAALSAGPAVRRMARELGVELSQVTGAGRKGRVTKEDLQAYIKARLQTGPQGIGVGLDLAPQATIDFSQFGPITLKPLSKIKRLTASNVHRSWLTIPQVTQFDEADITELEAFCKSQVPEATASGYKLTVLAFVCKIAAKALQQFPQFNASLDASGENLIIKDYVNIGVAVETPNGLVVPVIKDIPTQSVADIAREMGRLSTKAREKGLMPGDMSGGCFTISSLGGIGGTAFTPIVNAPEVAILGLSRSVLKPVYVSSHLVPRLMLPLSLSYDHRVIDGAEAARFTRFIAEQLNDIRRVLL